MRDHDDEALPRDLFDEVHDLHAGVGIERARGFVGEQDVGVVDERTRDGDALHLPARELVGLFIELFPEPHPLQRLGGALFALLARDARDGERELHVAEHRLMRDEVVALEDKADAVIAVDVPIAVFEVPRGLALDDEVARGVLIEPADDVEEGGFSAARRAQNAHELVGAEVEAHPFERVHGARRHFVVLFDVNKL